MSLSKELTIRDKVFVGLLCSSAVLAVGYILFGKAGFVAFFKSQEVAAWVQAVGSIVAIAATGYWAVH